MIEGKLMLSFANSSSASLKNIKIGQTYATIRDSFSSSIFLVR
jgi:hypothetical protein